MRPKKRADSVRPYFCVIYDVRTTRDCRAQIYSAPTKNRQAKPIVALGLVSDERPTTVVHKDDATWEGETPAEPKAKKPKRGEKP